uniref:60S ribosomal protein L2, mitochondrial n=1 Tax=Ophioglossum californicum TaxID=1267209 RepID=A0A1B3TRE7_9MONI|nr:ribosomal protein L2 [Ophioglossum californicum]YP_010439830.1 ribosomal protein L2 [Ophioglossum vulgatum]AOH05883.1 ribosomal protein L2 [Ophioglossum californicum]UTD44876.1 ribosomal protein L2 [Ophioglossum vulgatum]
MISGREALKRLTNSLRRSAGRNPSGRITVFHRGGGSKRLQRRIDLKRSTSSLGVVERIEYDPNRSSWIASVQWIEGVLRPVRRKALPKTKAPRRWRTHSVLWAQRIRAAFLEQNKKRIFEPKHFKNGPEADERPLDEACKADRTPFTYILASHQLEAGKMVINYDWSNKPSTSFNTANKGGLQWLEEKLPWGSLTGGSWLRPGRDYADPYSNKKYILDSYFQMVGNCIPLAHIARGAWVHNIEWNPGEGAKLARAAGTKAKIVEKLENTSKCIVRLPPGVHKLLDSRCRATIGIVSNPNHGTRKLDKAGESRWLGRRPIVRGVAMNPVDHPHGGGEGRTSGGRPSVSPWGKPTKSGFKTVVRKRQN